MITGEWEEVRPGVVLRRVYDTDGDYEYEYKFHCQDCGLSSKDEAHEDFMVHDSLWRKTMHLTDPKDPGGLICMSCFEKRLGRALVLEDYILYPVNKPHLRRLGYEAPEGLRGLDDDRESFGEVTQAYAYLTSPEDILAQLRVAPAVVAARDAVMRGEVTKAHVTYWVNCILCGYKPGARYEAADRVVALFAALVDARKRSWVFRWLRELAVFPREDFRMACGVAALLHNEYLIELDQKLDQKLSRTV